MTNLDASNERSLGRPAPEGIEEAKDRGGTGIVTLKGIRVTRIDVAIIGFSVAAALLAASLTSTHDRPLAWGAMLGCAVALAFRGHPSAAGVAIAATSMFLRLAYVGIGYSTQVDHVRTAWERVLDGLSPYGILLPSGAAPPEPYTYGPLALLWWQPGVAVELLAAAGVLTLLVWTRSWLTLGLYAGLPFSVYLNGTGVNDYSPGLMIALSLVIARRWIPAGATLLAVAAAIKPYAFAWFLPMVGYGGVAATVTLIAVTVVLWIPLLGWGPLGFFRSIEMHGDVHPTPGNALNIPWLRWVALPVVLLSFLFRSWTGIVLIGSAAFVTYLFLDRWASLGYWLAVIPIAGIALEGHFFHAARETSMHGAMPVRQRQVVP